MPDRPYRAVDNPDENEEDVDAIDMTAVQADDALIDALAAGDLRGAIDRADSDDPVVALLAAWAADTQRDAPLPPALTALGAAEPSTKPTYPAAATGPRSRWVRPTVAAAGAAAVLALGLLGVEVTEAQPEDPLWGLSAVINPERARSVLAASEVSAGLERVRTALREGRPLDAAHELELLRVQLASIRDAEGRSVLDHEHAVLSSALAGVSGVDVSQSGTPHGTAVPVTPSNASPRTRLQDPFHPDPDRYRALAAPPATTFPSPELTEPPAPPADDTAETPPSGGIESTPLESADSEPAPEPAPAPSEPAPAPNEPTPEPSEPTPLSTTSTPAEPSPTPSAPANTAEPTAGGSEPATSPYEPRSGGPSGQVTAPEVAPPANNADNTVPRTQTSTGAGQTTTPTPSPEPTRTTPLREDDRATQRPVEPSTTAPTPPSTSTTSNTATTRPSHSWSGPMSNEQRTTTWSDWVRRWIGNGWRAPDFGDGTADRPSPISQGGGTADEHPSDSASGKSSRQLPTNDDPSEARSDDATPSEAGSSATRSEKDHPRLGG